MCAYCAMKMFCTTLFSPPILPLSPRVCVYLYRFLLFFVYMNSEQILLFSFPRMLAVFGSIKPTNFLCHIFWPNLVNGSDVLYTQLVVNGCYMLFVKMFYFCRRSVTILIFSKPNMSRQHLIDVKKKKHIPMIHCLSVCPSLCACACARVVCVGHC